MMKNKGIKQELYAEFKCEIALSVLAILYALVVFEAPGFPLWFVHCAVTPITNTSKTDFVENVAPTLLSASALVGVGLVGMLIMKYCLYDQTERINLRKAEIEERLVDEYAGIMTNEVTR